MTKFELNGVTFCNFGSNNYSNNMDLITCYPMPDNMVQRVLNGEFHGVWLNPAAPCNEEFYGLFGTKDQYKELYKQQKDGVISNRVIGLLGGFDAMRTASKEQFDAAQHQAESEYKDWWLD